MVFKTIRCQEKICPYGKKCGDRCILDEVCDDDLKGKGIIRERHKCPKGKAGKLQYVIVELNRE